MFQDLPLPRLKQEDFIDILRLVRSENIGPVTFFNLLQKFKTPQAAIAGVERLSATNKGPRAIKLCSHEAAMAEIAAVREVGAKFVLFGTEDYPPLLLRLSDPPPILTVKGNKELLKQERLIGLVGSRNASANGYNFARKISEDLGKQGYVIASGLARGIDTGAHRGSIETGSIAVIAGGIDTIYPPENKILYEELYNKGVVITEYAVGAAPLPHNFLSRNRIIAGISQGIVVVEASLRSGSLTTARLALENNREVFAVPGSPLDPRCKGSNDLIRQGAIIAESAEDIIPALGQGNRLSLREEPAIIDMEEEPADEAPERPEAASLVLEKLSPSPVLVDELLVQCQLTASEMLTVLLELELAGRLERHPGNRVSLRVEVA